MEVRYMYGSFYGWYFKCQSRTQTLAVIPAVHKAGRKRTCSVQIITDNDAWTTAFPADAFHGERKIFSSAGTGSGKRGFSWRYAHGSCP